MSADPSLFKAPKTYPQPPKNMYYEVPTTATLGERPKPIFPWEQNQTKPTRVFADDPLLTEPIQEARSMTTNETSKAEPLSPTTPTIAVGSPQPFASYNRTNAWDDMPEIERYIQNLPQNRRIRTQAFRNEPSSTHSREKEDLEKKDLPEPKRRLSMKLTDFPTEIERPSLPVTPAPIRRPSFWGEERDAAGELPGADGVPEQSDWDPIAKLEELQRKQSEVLAQGPSSPTRPIPVRQLPGSAPPEVTIEEATSVPSFGRLNFAGGSMRSNEDDFALSPIESAG